MLQLTFGEILMRQHFIKSDGPPLFERLARQDTKKLRKVMKNLITLMGPGVLANSIHEATEKLMLRSYPELLDFDGTQKLVIFIPERFLTKVPKYLDPSHGPELQNHAEVAASLHAPEEEDFFDEKIYERRRFFDDLKKFYVGGQRTYIGELSSRNLYDALQAYFNLKNESVAVFHSIDILKMNLDRFKVNDKDFVILNVTRRCIIVIDVKRTLGATPGSFEVSIEQLIEAKEDLEAWFGTEGLDNWTYIPMIYTEKNDLSTDNDGYKDFIIEGNYFSCR